MMTLAKTPEPEESSAPEPDEREDSYTFSLSVLVTLQFPRTKYENFAKETGEGSNHAALVMTKAGHEALVDDVAEFLGEELYISDVTLHTDELTIIDSDDVEISVMVSGQFSFTDSEIENPDDEEEEFEITECALDALKDDFTRLLEASFTVSELSCDDDGTFLGKD
jgi:hypothetical protein